MWRFHFPYAFGSSGYAAAAPGSSPTDADSYVCAISRATSTCNASIHAAHTSLYTTYTTDASIHAASTCDTSVHAAAHTGLYATNSADTGLYTAAHTSLHAITDRRAVCSSNGSRATAPGNTT